MVGHQGQLKIVEPHMYVCIVCLPSSGKISPWTGRFYSLLDPSYAKNNIPIIASVSEHQPTTWSSYYFDLQLLVFMFPGVPNVNCSLILSIYRLLFKLIFFKAGKKRINQRNIKNATSSRIII